MEGEGRRRRRSFSEEYKADVVRLCQANGQSIAAVAREIGIQRTVVQRWVTQAETDTGERDGLTSSEREELAQLRKEVRVLREERDILKRATAFFAKETR